MEAPIASAPAGYLPFLVVFATKHSTFRFPELRSLAFMFGVPDLKFLYDEDGFIQKDVKLERKGVKRQLPSEAIASGVSGAEDGAAAHTKQDYEQQNPYVIVFLPSVDVAQRVAQRSVGIKYRAAIFNPLIAYREIIALWGSGATYEEALAESLRHIKERRDPFFTADKPFKVDVKRFGATLPREDVQQILDKLPPLGLQGRVDLKNPATVLSVHEYWGRYHSKSPKAVYIGRFICESSRSKCDKLSLKKRVYLGTTSMDAELSLLMANQALAAPGTLVLDPFVGTGSLLCSSAEMGAMVMGGDIDPRVLRGADPEHCVLANMQQYNFMPRMVDIVVHDQASCSMRANPFLDAIIADPPYGIRAGAKKVGMKEKTKEKRAHASAPAPYLADHIPQTLPYEVPAVLTDLLSFAARTLVMGGRLVYWLPTTNEYKESDLPTHPCLRLEANSEQILTWVWRRRLITMVKCTAYEPAIHSNVQVHYNPTQLAHAHLVEKIFKTDEGDEAKEEKRKSKEVRKKKLAALAEAKAQRNQEPKQ